MCAAVALGVRETQAPREKFEGLEIPVEIVVGDHAYPMRALLDSGAEDDFISQIAVARHGLKLMQASLAAVAVDGRRIEVYGRLACELRARDSQGESDSTARQFISTNIKRYDLILGKKWLREVNPDVDWFQDTWLYRKTGQEIRLCATFKEVQLEPDEPVHVLWYKPAPTLRGGVELGFTNLEEVVLPSEFKDDQDVFDEQAASQFPADTKVEHSIPIEEGQTVPFGPIYPLSGKELETLREYIDTALAKGMIQHSESPAGAPILFVPKKDGTLRLCVDYRGLNKVTVKNRYPLPLISEILDRLSGAKFYSKLDIRDAYHRIRIAREDRWKTSFRTRYGQFEYLVMPFGLTNAPATFQSYINEALRGLLDQFCIAYMDDILIYSNTREEHTRHVRAVLARLREFSLFVKLSKCEFYRTEVDFLGYRVGVAGVSMDPSKVAAIEEWDEPKSFKDIQTFLGFANFYRGFIAGYSKIVTPITNLLVGMKAGKKTGPFEWSAEAAQAFRILKRKFQEAPLLKHYEPERECRVETDASGEAIGAVLTQAYEAQGDSKRTVWHPIAFMSKKMSPAERNYATGDQEMLAIVAAFKEWRHYLESPAKCTRVLTDHEALVRFMDDKPLSRKRQTRWAETLAVYDFVIQWRRGKDNPADALSRRPDHMEKDEVPTGNALQELIALRAEGAPTPHALRMADTVWIGAITRARTQEKKSPQDSEWNVIRRPALEARKKRAKPAKRVTNKSTGEVERAETSPAPQMLEVGEPLAGQVRQLQGRDAFCSEQKWNLFPDGRVTTPPMEGTWCVDHAGIVRNDGAVYIPDDMTVKQEILRVNHDDPWQGGHFGRTKTLEVLQRCYWWPQMRRTVDAYIASCDICQRMKAPRHKPYGLLEGLPLPQGPWQDIAMDFVTGLPPAKHRRQVYDAILVIVCRYSKMAKFIPCTQDINAPELADVLCDEVISEYGTPKSIVSDRGSLFTSGYWATFCYELAIRRRLSTAFHPQTDGQTERMNQTMECYLRCYSNSEQDDWPMLLASAQYAVNNSRNETTKKTPFEVVYTFQPTMNKNIEVRKPESTNEASKQKAEEIVEAQKQLRAAWEQAQSTIIASYNRKRKNITFREGDKVLLSAKNIRLRRASKKLSDRFLGPFVIERKVSNTAYRLKLPQKYNRLHPVFHISLLQAYSQREGCEPPEAIDIEGEEEWEVESILDAEGRGKKRTYLVKWKGWSSDYDSWEPVEHLDNAKEIIEKYNARGT